MSPIAILSARESTLGTLRLLLTRGQRRANEPTGRAHASTPLQRSRQRSGRAPRRCVSSHEASVIAHEGAARRTADCRESHASFGCRKRSRTGEWPCVTPRKNTRRHLGVEISGLTRDSVCLATPTGRARASSDGEREGRIAGRAPSPIVLRSGRWKGASQPLPSSRSLASALRPPELRDCSASRRARGLGS